MAEPFVVILFVESVRGASYSYDALFLYENMDEKVKRIQEQLKEIFPEDKLRNWIRKCERENAMWKFYKSRWFRSIRAAVLEEQHNECQKCRARGKIVPADTVHHEKHVRDYPELALTAYYVDENGEEIRNLTAICKSCHALEHPEKLKNEICTSYVNEERW